MRHEPNVYKRVKIVLRWCCAFESSRHCPNLYFCCL